MKKTLFKNINVALIALAAGSLVQTAVANFDEDFQDSITTSKSTVAPMTQKNQEVTDLIVTEEDEMNDFVIIDANNLHADNNAQILTMNGHLYVGKQHLYTGSDHLYNGAVQLGSGMVNASYFAANVAHDIDCISSSAASTNMALKVGVSVVTGKENPANFEAKSAAHLKDARNSAEAFINNVPKTANYGFNAVKDIGCGIFNLGQATYSISIGAYHVGYAGVQATQTSCGYLSNWWNGK